MCNAQYEGETAISENDYDWYNKVVEDEIF
jgi:hypothetical protein